MESENLSTEIVPIQPIQRPGRLLPLKPLEIPNPAPRRRLSSWTENLEGENSSSIDNQRSPTIDITPSSAEISQKSPLQKIAGFFSEKSSSVQKEPKLQKQASIEKGKGLRRESIKDHLLKFKQKAGKVLEEVHERFSEDHSTVAPLVPSPSRTEGVESDEPSGSERIASPSSVSTTSKKTGSSAELKASLRNKIRKQAEKVVERTRGSVQLTKRLQRRLTVHNEETITEEEVKNVDEQIENSLKIGEKFMAQQPPSLIPTDEEQLLFFTGTYPDSHTIPIKSVISYSAAVPSKEEDPKMFIFYEPDANDAENRGAFPISFMLRKRLPMSVWTEQLGKGAIKERKFKWEMPEEEEGTFLPALTAEMKQAAEEERMHLQMKVTLSFLNFVNHAFCSVEEGIAASLRHAHAEQIALFEKGGQMLKEAEEKGKSSARGFEKEMAKLEQKLSVGSDALRQQWNALEASRAAQGYALSPLRYTPSAENENPYYGTISEDFPVKETNSLEKEVQERLKQKNSTNIRISLFYNDILVGKTPPRNLGNFNIFFGETFNLEVKSIPQKLHAIIVEKNKGKETDIARIEIKIPWTKNEARDDQGPIPFQEFNEEKEMADRSRGFLLARINWTPPEDMEREKEAEITERIHEEPFSLIPRQCRLVSDEDFDGNLRWELLEQRQRKKLPKLLESKPIAIDSSEIDPSLVINDERNQFATGARTGIDGHRILGSGYASRIRTKILEKRNDTERRLTYEELVKEIPLPSGIGGIGGLFGPADTSRKLKPMRLETTRQQATPQSGARLLVNIQSASNLPERKNSNLQPIVEVRFQSKSSKTTPAAGRHPNWQQCIILPMDVEHISDLKTITEALEIDIYDQIVAPLPRDDREANTVHEQLVYRFIGNVCIPFSTVYCRGRIDGGLRVQIPLFITGYNISNKPTYIKVLIALEPPLCAPKLSSQALETNEPEKIIQQCEAWLKANREQFEDRRYSALVNDINGKNVLVCRYLRSIKAPPSLEPIVAGRKTMEKLTRVVSFIPFLADPLLFPGHLDLWTTIDQFVSYGCGDEEEHAILLCCWLLGNRVTSYVALGSALPDGEKAAFVLVDLPEYMLLLNPVDGSVYQADDPMCPMTSIGTVFSADNAYGNIQPRAHPSQMNFDFTKTNEWRPLFTKSDSSIVSVQPSGIIYQEVTEDSVVELRSSIERELKLKFDEARPFAIPQWNLMASRLLREILNEENFNQNILDERFNRLRESYNVIATAIKIPYRSLSKAVEEIMRLKLHLNTDPNIQFALGVHIQPYFNNIVGCSLGLAALLPKK